jgi:hypothetical protein
VFIAALRAGLAKDTTAGADVIALTVTPARLKLLRIRNQFPQRFC